MTLCIIPCALDMKEELREQFGNIPNALVPLDGKPLLDYIIGTLKEFADSFCVVSNEISRPLFENYCDNKKNNLNLTSINDSADLAETILCGYENAYGAEVTKIILNFGDTYTTSNQSFDSDSVVYSRESDTEKWTSFSEDNGRIIEIVDKEYTGNTDKVFVGQFCFTNVTLFIDLLRSERNFYTALQKYSESIKLYLVEAVRWVDVGHLERYYQSRQIVSARYFNHIKIDTKRGVITKQSDDKEKLAREIGWYLKMPLNLKYMTPHIYDCSSDVETAFVKMEYYTYSTLHELLIFSDLPYSVWDGVTENLLFYLNEMNSFKKEVTHLEFKDCVREMYFEKTRSRVEQYRDIDHNELIRINAHNYHSLKFYTENLDVALYRSGVYERDVISIIHGDYCASNILVDIKRNILRLIDPRGSFGKYDIFGDPLYDVAKLMHSFDGKYDFIIADYFQVSANGNSFEYRLLIKDKQRQICEKLITRIKTAYREDYTKIRLIESLLFLSMLPLHGDNLDRQVVMLCVGIELIDSVYEELDIK